MLLELTAAEAAAVRLVLDELPTATILDALRAISKQHELPLDELAAEYTTALRKIDNFINCATDGPPAPTRSLLTVIPGGTGP